MKLSRTDWKYLVDTLMVLALVGIVLIGLLLGFVIPEGRLGPGQSKSFLGLHRHQWGDIHLYLSLAFTVLVIVHLVLSWSWIRGKARALFGRAWKAAVGLTLVAALVVPVVFWLAAKKNDPAYADHGQGIGIAGQRELGTEVMITGRTTLGDIERSTGLSAREIAGRLGLPPDVSLDESLGRLRRAHGFEIQTVKDIVAELLKDRRSARPR